MKFSKIHPGSPAPNLRRGTSDHFHLKLETSLPSEAGTHLVPSSNST